MASDSSAASSPMLLTPDSTGYTEPPPSNAAAKKARRQTAFYPNVNSTNKPQKPFSRSAAKRESVMALGSIEHLQHYFTKTGIEAKKNAKAGKVHHGLVPVFGGLTHVRTESTESNPMELPPSPALPQPTVPAFPPYVKTFEMDPESLLPGVIDDLSDVAFAWQIDQTVAPPAHAAADRLSVAGSGRTDSLDVLTVLKTTTRAIRSVRNYLLSLPDESAGTIRAHFRSRQAPGSFRPLPPIPSGLSSSSSLSDLRGAAHAAKEKERKEVEQRTDPLTLIRKAALEVLTVLRELEERCRLPLSDDAYDAQSEGGSKGGHSRMASPSTHSDELSPEEGDNEHHHHERDADTSVAFSLVQVNGRFESVPVWEEEEAPTWDDDDDKTKKEGWDEKLVLGSGWLYQQNVRLEDLEKERRVVSAYLDVVDEALFEGKKTGEAAKERGWERERRKALEKEGRGSVRSKSRANKRRGSSMETDAGTQGPTVLTPSTTGDKARRRVSVGMFDMMSSFRITEEPSQMGEIGEEEDNSEDSIDDEELPQWARRKGFEDDELGRAHAILAAFLPPTLLPALLPSSSRGIFLDCLSSGQLLCVAYNTCVRKSKKPWGYISRDGIHDILALEQAAQGDPDDTKAQAEVKRGWTFRRIDNLRLWAGALKIRYLLPIVAPAPTGGTATPNSNTPLNSPAATTVRFNPEQPPVVFDAKAVARKDAGWEDILEGALLRWVQRVVAERRGET
ncbi:hypothetical protein B0H16DRAFT_1687640 [Mycena metata]|uniref:Uncharacterized protein n=1 Tax=Mycena metata TaxID=1033252 RepID=A0AAD7JLD0_9AGAR|nr:hypothetical protein B0H16DRAFT_1687640 [Mycena metata]